MVQNILDYIVSALFGIAVLIIAFFIGQYVYEKILGQGGEDALREQLREEEEYYDVDDYYDDEDLDYGETEAFDGLDFQDAYEPAAEALAEDELSPEELAEADRTLLEEQKPEESSPPAETAPKPAAPKPAPSETGERPETSDDPNDPNPFLVIAGTFSTLENARIHAAAVRKKGYEPEIVQFDGSSMHTVIASRHAERPAANAAAQAVKAKGIDCYVHAKRSE